MADANPFAQFVQPDAGAPAVADTGENPFAQFVPSDNAAHGDLNSSVNAATGGFVRGIPVAGPYIDTGAKKMAAHVRSLIYGTPYDDELKAVNDYAAQTEKAHPVLETGGRIAGNIATLAPAGATALGARALGIEGPSLLARVGAGTASGSAIGAADAAARGEDVKQGAELGALGGAGGSLGGEVLGKVLAPFTASAERQAAAKTLENAGVTDLTAGQVTGSRKLQMMESELGGGAAGQKLANQKEQFTSAALKQAGIDADRATPEVIDKGFNDVGDKFDALAKRNTMVGDRPFIDGIKSSVRDYFSLVPESQRAPVVENTVRDLATTLKNNGNTLNGEAYQAMRSRLDKMARASRNDPQLQEALFGIRNAMDGAMERNIQPADSGAWQEARREYKNLLTISKASTAAGQNAAEGLISPQQLRSVATRGGAAQKAYSRGQGDFADLARAGNVVMPQLPDSGTAMRLAAHGVPAMLASGLGALVGSHAGVPGGTEIGAMAGPVLSPLAGRLMMSTPAQAYLRGGLSPAVSPLARVLAGGSRGTAASFGQNNQSNTQ